MSVKHPIHSYINTNTVHAWKTSKNVTSDSFTLKAFSLFVTLVLLLRTKHCVPNISVASAADILLIVCRSTRYV